MPSDGRLTARVPLELQVRIDDVARERGLNRSQTVRVLLEAALGSDAAMATVEEVGFEMAKFRKSILTRIGAEIREQTPAIIEDILREGGVPE